MMNIFQAVAESASDEDRTFNLVKNDPSDLRSICSICNNRINIGHVTYSHPLIGFHFCHEHAIFSDGGSIKFHYQTYRYAVFDLVLLEEKENLNCMVCDKEIFHQEFGFVYRDQHDKRSGVTHTNCNATSEAKLEKHRRTFIMRKSKPLDYKRCMEIITKDFGIKDDDQNLMDNPRNWWQFSTYAGKDVWFYNYEKRLIAEDDFPIKDEKWYLGKMSDVPDKVDGEYGYTISVKTKKNNYTPTVFLKDENLQGKVLIKLA